jgi:hypothetical protein
LTDKDLDTWFDLGPIMIQIITRGQVNVTIGLFPRIISVDSCPSRPTVLWTTATTRRRRRRRRRGIVRDQESTVSTGHHRPNGQPRDFSRSGRVTKQLVRYLWQSVRILCRKDPLKGLEQLNGLIPLRPFDGGTVAHRTTMATTTRTRSTTATIATTAHHHHDGTGGRINETHRHLC